MSNTSKSYKEKRRKDFEEQVINMIIYFIITLTIVLFIRTLLHYSGIYPMWILPPEEIHFTW